MRARSLIRFAMIAVFVVVVITVFASWRGRPDDITATESVGPDTPEGVVSLTRAPRFTSVVNGVTQYEVFAGRALSFEGGRHQYDEDVELTIYGEPAEEGAPPKVTRVTAVRLEAVEREVPVEGDPYETVRLRDNVRVILPDGAEFTSDSLRFSDDTLSTNQGARLRAGGLVVESRTLNYDPETGVARLSGRHEASQRPQIPGPVKLWSEPAASAPGSGVVIEGSSNNIAYDVTRSSLRLLNRPEIRLPQATVTAAEISLGLDELTTSIKSIDATGRARAVWLQPAGAGEYVASGDVISVQLLEGQPQGLRVSSVSEETPRPRFDLGYEGALRADVIDLGFGGGDAGSVVARGRAFFFPEASAGGVTHIKAESLTVGAGGLEEFHADGDVEVLIDGDEGEVAFTGPRARFIYRDNTIAAAEWPAGISYRAADREVSAGSGAYQPDSGNWLLEGLPRPLFRSQEFDVEADEILLRAEGGVDLRGAVQAQLRGEVIRTVGPLFGGATQIEAAAGELQVNRDNRLTFREGARIWRAGGDQLLQADEIKLLPAANELQAEGHVFVNLVDPPDEAGGREEARTVLLTGRRLLVADTPLAIVVVGEALLELEGEDRTIGGDRLEVQLSEDGSWDSMEVRDSVVMKDPAGTGEGARLEYNADTGLVVIHASDAVDATFISEQGIEFRDQLGLRLEWEGDTLRVTAMQNGTTQTVRGGQR